MKDALQAVREVEEYERKKRIAKSQYQEMLNNARKGQLDLTTWEKYITLPKFKKQLEQECRPMEHKGEYYVHPFLCGVHSGRWDAKWINYGAFLLEQLGYLDIEVHVGIVKELYLRARCPKTQAEQILFSKKGS